jgi:hypothetical protein
MPDLICDPTFEHGLWFWAHSPGVEVVDAVVTDEGGVLRVARVPPGEYLAGNLGNLHPVGDLNFYWLSLGSAEPAMDVRVDYTDGTQLVRELRADLFHRDPMMALVSVHLEGHRGITSFRLDNVGGEGQDWGVFFLPIRGRDDEVQRCPAIPVSIMGFGPGWVREMFWRMVEESRASQPVNKLSGFPPQGFLSDEMDAKLEAKLFSIDMKLNKLLELLTHDQKSRSSKPSGKGAIEA